MRMNLKFKRPRSKRCPKFRGMGRKVISLLTRLDKEYLEIIVQEVSDPRLSNEAIDKEILNEISDSDDGRLLSPVTMSIVNFIYAWMTRRIKVKFTDTGRYGWNGMIINNIKIKELK